MLNVEKGQTELMVYFENLIENQLNGQYTHHTQVVNHCHISYIGACLPSKNIDEPVHC